MTNMSLSGMIRQSIHQNRSLGQQKGITIVHVIASEAKQSSK